jgi:hypothetical protein
MNRILAKWLSPGGKDVPDGGRDIRRTDATTPARPATILEIGIQHGEAKNLRPCYANAMEPVSEISHEG